MDTVEQSVYITSLFDVYQGLLTEKQQTYMRDYYYDDLSLQEIAENYGVSRNAVHDQIKKTIQKLESYEETLHLYKKQRLWNDLLSKLDDLEMSEDVSSLIEALKKVE